MHTPRRTTTTPELNLLSNVVHPRRVNHTLVFALTCLITFTSAPRPASPKDINESYDDGKPKLHFRTDDKDRKSGVYEEFHPNGKLKIRGQYTADKKSGQWQTYDDTGKLIESAGYRNDLLEGPYLWNFPTGKPALRATYHLGQLSGSITSLDEKGRIARRIGYPRMREAVEKMFLSSYPMEKPHQKFTAEASVEPPYKAGVLSPDTLETALKLTKLYRYLSGVPFADLRTDPVLCDISAHGAVVLSKIGSLTHHPDKPADMDAAFFKLAYAGCAEDNLFMGNGNPLDAVRGFMDDSDESNVDRVGHRQWVLSPGLQRIGFGSAGRFVSMHVFDGNRQVKLDYNFIAFPGEGFYPRRLVEPHYAWSLHLNNAKAKLANAGPIKIALRKLDEHFQPAGDVIAAKVISTPSAMSPAFGWSVIVFKPDWTEMESARYWVEVSGIQTSGGADASFGYIVDLIDIAVAGKD